MHILSSMLMDGVDPLKTEIEPLKDRDCQKVRGVGFEPTKAFTMGT
jgi:hypothetical protein